MWNAMRYGEPIFPFLKLFVRKLWNIGLWMMNFFSEVFRGDTEAVSFLLGIILDRNDLQVTRVDTQAEYKNAVRRSVRLDIRAVGADGRSMISRFRNRIKGLCRKERGIIPV